MDTGLKDKGVIVTGGAGGIGSAMCRAFAGEEARVCVHYRNSEDRAIALANDVGLLAEEYHPGLGRLVGGELEVVGVAHASAVGVLTRLLLGSRGGPRGSALARLRARAARDRLPRGLRARTGARR